MNAADSFGPPALVDELFSRFSPRRGHVIAAWVLALSLHAALGLFAFGHRATEQALDVPLEVELLAPPPPAPEPPPPEPEPEAKAPEPVVVKPVVARAPAAAAAPNVLTAPPEPSAPAPAEPFDFTSDPRSTMLGAGVVAVGGTAAFGVQGAKADGVGSKPVIPARAGDGLVAHSDLSRKPSLPRRDPCRGYFPRGAQDDAAEVVVRVVVAKDGRVTSVRILSESIPRQGFGEAARACMEAQRFEPALNHSGAAVATAIPVNVRFSR
jgi:periplasmic protein TonB